MDFQYRTGEEAPGGHRPTVLISMHPVDRCTYLESLCRRILGDTGCTLCYSVVPVDGEESLPEGVDLVLAGVTEKYLTWNNSGFQSETLPAVRRGIPLLPVMLEPGIVNLFNTRCGKFHYVDGVGESLPEESLRQINTHIATLLCREDPVEEGKPGIFISYRKRDVAQLRRLVERLDAHPARDTVSLWYDTSLQPGDDYRRTIEEQLRGCSLFLLVVTPRLLEPDNYVMRVEYPLAVKEKKPILPVIMEKTDQKKLAACFPALPKCLTDAQIDGIFAKIGRPGKK